MPSGRVQEKTCLVFCKGGYLSLLHICLGGHRVKGATGPAAEDGQSVLATVGYEAANYAGHSFHSGLATTAARPESQDSLINQDNRDVGECGLPLVCQSATEMPARLQYSSKDRWWGRKTITNS